MDFIKGLPRSHGNETILVVIDKFTKYAHLFILSHLYDAPRQYADRRRSERIFEVGDKVFLKLQLYRQMSVAIRRNLKLVAKFYRPFEIIRRIGQVAYELQLPSGSKIHPIFHVSQLKKVVCGQVAVLKEPPHCTDEGQILTEPFVILERRMVKKGNKVVVQVLVQWANLSKEEATWEDYSFLKSQFPDFDP
ncbi:uncharacterized protein [Nicotiana sylvestris]|uniref:uncharacterized protein n=1 Tax=Nicotiana sylvestris TaxID=4096 RepID=UPI00388C7842